MLFERLLFKQTIDFSRVTDRAVPFGGKRPLFET